MRRSLKRLALLSLPFALSGCVTFGENFEPGLGFEYVASRSGETIGKDTVWIQNTAQANAVNQRVSQLLAPRYVSADSAVQIALLNNKGLQAAYAEIGLSVTDLWQESLFENPSLSVSYLGIGGTRTIEGFIASNIIALMTRDRRLDVAEVRVMQAKLRAIERTLSLATQTRQAWVEAVAAWETVGYLNRAKTAADAAAELAAELGRTGALPRPEQAREQAFYAEITGQVAEARLSARLAKERLIRLMGVWGRSLDFEVPNALPDLPGRLRNQNSIEAQALQNRVDLQVAKLELDALARSYGLTQATRYVSDLELAAGLELEQEIEEEEDGGETETNKLSGAVEVSFQIPIFDSGQARLRRAEFAYLRAANLLAEKGINIRSEARSAHQAYRSTHEIARHYRSSVIPLSRIINEEAVLTYNAMLTSPFNLLADARGAISSNILFLNAKRSFWLADAGLTAAIYGGGGAAEAGGEVEMAESGGAEH
ncbi:MAG: TolC family protein [Aurantimonas endophytica]|uniref:TolC family protein n=1 Tax=Aurantimonas endophytica TaxID=1522175 RepID=UPI0030021D33